MYGGVCLYVLRVIIVLRRSVHVGPHVTYIYIYISSIGVYVQIHILLSRLALFSMVWISTG